VTGYNNGGPLRPGDIVEVRPASEILATLDKDGALKGMLFMPEMTAHAGKRFTVTRRVDKICNTVDLSGSRQMQSTVYLDDLRCDGAAHGGCQAACMIYWREEWLRRVEENSPSSPSNQNGTAELERIATAATRTATAVAAEPSEGWRCQATDALKASEPLKRSDIRQYWREMTNGNFGLLRFTGLMIRALVMECAFMLKLLKPLPLRASYEGLPVQRRPLNLQTGDVVKVRKPKEIAGTLDKCGMNRGLSFDREMLPFCGRTFRVRDTVRRIIDDKTGRMLTIPRDSIILDGAVCSGELSVNGRWLCPRQIYPFWRESWLERADEPEGRALKLASTSAAQGSQDT